MSKGTNDVKIIPNTGKLAVEVETRPEEVTPGGILLPQEKAPYTRAKIVSIGLPRISPEGVRIHSQFEVGDSVVLQPYVGNTIICGGRPVLIVSESEVVCKLEGEVDVVGFGKMTPNSSR